MASDGNVNGALLRGLDARQAERFAAMFRPETFEPGEVMMRQGRRSEFALTLTAGEAEAVRELPGGEAFPLGVMGPGAAIGEMGLLIETTRLATVRARTAVAASMLSDASFRGACDGLDPVCLAVARNILGIAAERLSEQKGRVLAEQSTGLITRRPTVPADAEAAVDFDWRAFCRILPSLRHFAPEELRDFVDVAQPLALPKGELLIRAGAPIETANFVLRGAVAGAHPKGGVDHSLNALGPGELCASAQLLLGESSPVDYRAREAAVVLQIPATAYRAMLDRDDELGLAVIKATAWTLARGYRRANNALGNFHRLERAKDGPLAAATG